MEGSAGDLGLFIAGPALLYITVLHQFFLDLDQIVLTPRNIQGGADGLQMVDLSFCLQGQAGEGFIGPLQLVVFVKMLLCIVLG